MRLVISILLVLLLSDCTPLGLWMYEDPTVTVSDVRIQTGALIKGERVEVVLTVRNRNDYDVLVDSVVVSLALDSVPLGKVLHAPGTPVPRNASTNIRIPLDSMTPQAVGMLSSLQPGIHAYRVGGAARIGTPIGERRVSFQLSAQADFGVLHWRHREYLWKGVHGFSVPAEAS
jgi:hypothetical protein